METNKKFTMSKTRLYKRMAYLHNAYQPSSIDYLFLLVMLIGLNALIIFGK